MSKRALKPSQFGKAYIQVAYDATLSDVQLSELGKLYEDANAHIKVGKIISGKILSIEPNGILVDIEYKSNGLIPLYEFGEHELRTLKANDLIDVIIAEIENIEGAVSLSYEKAKALKAWEKITKLHEEGKPVEGIVTQAVKGGLSVDIGVPAFLPGSQVDIQRVTDFDQFIGKPIIAEIIKINRKRGNVIISRRKYLSEERASARKKAMETLLEGAIIQGVVKNITNYGVFIDIGGVDGLLHITDMTWGRIGHPSEVVRIGENITVKVLSIDKENGKISLGMKQLTDNPWSALTSSIQIGSKIKGKIASITDYGLFVEIAPGVEGLVHISEISWTDRVSNLNTLYKVGDEIEVHVVSLDKDNRRMSLSVKQLQEDPWKSVGEKFRVGQIVKGPITNITDFGIFIQLMPGVDGLAHISDLSWTEHIDHPSHRYKRGEEVEAIVLNIDEASKKISLGIKQLTVDPLEAFAAQHGIGSIIDGEISKFSNIGIFVKVAEGIDGLVHNTELVTKNGKKETKRGELLEIGAKRQFRLVNINLEERKVDLSTILDEQVDRFIQQEKARPRKRESAPPMPKAKNQLQLALERLESEME